MDIAQPCNPASLLCEIWLHFMSCGFVANRSSVTLMVGQREHMVPMCPGNFKRTTTFVSLRVLLNTADCTYIVVNLSPTLPRIDRLKLTSEQLIAVTFITELFDSRLATIV